MYFLGLSLVFALGAQNQNPYALHKAMDLTWEDSISLFGSYEYKNAAIRFNDKFYKLEGNKVVLSTVTIRGKPHSLDTRGNLSSTREESIQIDTYELGKSESVNYLNSIVQKVDSYLLTTHSVVDLQNGHSINFPNDSVIAGAYRNEVLYVALYGAKTEIGIIKRYRKQSNEVGYETALKLEKIDIKKPGCVVDGIAVLEEGFLISVWDGKRSLLNINEKGSVLAKIADEEIKPGDGSDRLGVQFPRLVTFDKGKKFLWATEQTLWYGEEKSPLR